MASKIRLWSAFLAYLLLSGCASSGISSDAGQVVTPAEASDLIKAHEGDSDFVILDVRRPKEFATGHLKNAVNLDYYSPTFREDLQKLARDRTYLVHCETGKRALQVIALMQDLNFLRVYNLVGGIAKWKAQGFPVGNGSP